MEAIKAPTTINKLACPICGYQMSVVNGDQVSYRNGITVICYRKECPSTENVFGHGKTEKDAYETACLKFGRYVA